MTAPLPSPSARRPDPLSDPERLVLAAIVRAGTAGQFASIRGMAADLDRSTYFVYAHASRLRRRGLVRVVPGRAYAVAVDGLVVRVDGTVWRCEAIR